MRLLEIIILEVVFVIISLIWFKDGNIIFGHDSTVSLLPIEHFKSLIYSWNPLINFGNAWSHIYSKAFLLTFFPETFFYVISGNNYVAQFLSCLFWLSTMGMAMYAYISNIFRDPKYYLIRIFSSVFYVMNFYILQAWLIDERTKFSLYAALPIGLLIIRKMFSQDKFNIRYPIYLSLLFLLFSGGGQPPYYGSILIAYPIYFLLHVFVFSEFSKKTLWRSVKYASLSIGLILLINSYYVIPYIYDLGRTFVESISSNGGVNSYIQWEKEISKNASIINLFRLEGIPDWYNNPAHPYANQFLMKRSLIFFSYLPIIVIFLGVALTKWRMKEEKSRKNEIFFILILLCVGLFFAGGTHPPFGILYAYAMEHIPGFIMFRSSFYKFAPLLWFSVSVLTGYFLMSLSEYIFSRRLKFIFAVGACLGLLCYHYPYFSTTAFNFSSEFSTRLKVPSYVTTFGTKINEIVPSDGRIILYPSLDMGFIGSPIDSYTWGYYSLDPMPRTLLNHPIIANDTYGTSQLIESIQQSLHDEDSQTLLSYASISGITHVLWRGDVKRSEAMDRDISLIDMENRLSTMSALSKEVAEGPWSLYKINASVRPMIYVANKVDYTNKSASQSAYLLKNLQNDTVLLKTDDEQMFFEIQDARVLPEIVFTEKNPTKYSIKIANDNEKPYILVFNQKFDLGWRATAHQTNGDTVFLKNHYEANSFANAWVVDQASVAKIELEYMPQRYFYYGLAVTGITIIGIVIYMIKTRKRTIITKRKQNEK